MALTTCALGALAGAAGLPCDATSYVHDVRDWFKMIWPNAGPVAAAMVDLAAFWNRAAVEDVGDPMSQHFAMGRTRHATVTVRVGVRGPQPAPGVVANGELHDEAFL